MSKTVEFIIPTWNRDNELKVILSCLVAQTDKEWTAVVVIDDYAYSDVVQKTSKLISSFEDERISFMITNQRSKDFGHTPRELGKQNSKADYIIMTGDDNYYVPTFVSELKKELKGSPGMVYWDMVHNSFDYSYFKCIPANGQIDIGAFAVKTDLAKQIKLGSGYAADGEFVEDFKKKFRDYHIFKINKVLYVHN